MKIKTDATGTFFQSPDSANKHYFDNTNPAERMAAATLAKRGHPPLSFAESRAFFDRRGQLKIRHAGEVIQIDDLLSTMYVRTDRRGKTYYQSANTRHYFDCEPSREIAEFTATNNQLPVRCPPDYQWGRDWQGNAGLSYKGGNVLCLMYAGALQTDSVIRVLKANHDKKEHNESSTNRDDGPDLASGEQNLSDARSGNELESADSPAQV